MFTIINSIIVFRKLHTRAWPSLQVDASQCYILCFSHIRVEADIQWCKIILHGLGPTCSSSCGHSSFSWSNFFLGSRVILHALGPTCSRAFFCLFHPTTRFPIADSKALRRLSFGKLWQCDRINIICLNECRQRENWPNGIALVDTIYSPLNEIPFIKLLQNST